MKESNTARRAVPVYPLLAVAFPMVSLLSTNAGTASVSELYRPLAVAELGVLVVWALGALAFRSIERGAMFVFVITVFFFGFGLVGGLSADLDPTVFKTGFAVCAVVVAALCARFRPTRLLNFASGAGLGIASVITVSHALGAQPQKAADVSKAAAGNFKDLPDIYYIVLDGHGRTDALRRYMGYDDSQFVEGLRKLGFYVAEKSQSNYCQTALSLGSSLNFDLLPNVVPGAERGGADLAPAITAVDEPKLEKVLRSAGYQTIVYRTNFPMFKYEGFEKSYKSAESYSEFEIQLLEMTPFQIRGSVLGSLVDKYRASMYGVFDNLKSRAGQSDGPHFVFTHVLSPHPPFVFGPNGEKRKYERFFTHDDGSDLLATGLTLADYRRGYTEQAEFVETRTLEALRSIIHDSGGNAIIVVQGDHGSRSHMDWHSFAKSDVRELFPILNAYYVPPSIRAKLYPEISPVNTFRVILGELLHIDLPLRPDRSWWSGSDKPFEFIDCTDTVRNAYAKAGS